MRTTRILLLLVLSSFCGASYSSVSVGEAVVIYNKLIKQNMLKRPTKFIIWDFNTINAWATPDFTLNITTKDLTLTKPELTMLIAHELAHIQFDDMHTLGDYKTHQEDRADYYGMLYSENIGYSRCTLAALFLRFYKQSGNQGGSKDPHSKNLTRFWRVYKGCNK